MPRWVRLKTGNACVVLSDGTRTARLPTTTAAHARSWAKDKTRCYPKFQPVMVVVVKSVKRLEG